MPAPLSPAATLDLWADAERRGPVERTLVLAAAGEDDGASPVELVGLPLGRRDARVLSLHGALGGRTLEATAACPACGEHAEFAVGMDALAARGREAVAPAPVAADGIVVTWRPPDSADLAAAGEAGDAPAAERVLLSRCVLAATGPEGDVRGTELRPRCAPRWRPRWSRRTRWLKCWSTSRARRAARRSSQISTSAASSGQSSAHTRSACSATWPSSRACTGGPAGGARAGRRAPRRVSRARPRGDSVTDFVEPGRSACDRRERCGTAAPGRALRAGRRRG